MSIIGPRNQSRAKATHGEDTCDATLGGKVSGQRLGSCSSFVTSRRGKRRRRRRRAGLRPRYGYIT